DPARGGYLRPPADKSRHPDHAQRPWQTLQPRVPGRQHVVRHLPPRRPFPSSELAGSAAPSGKALLRNARSYSTPSEAGVLGAAELRTALRLPRNEKSVCRPIASRLPKAKKTAPVSRLLPGRFRG